MVSFFFVVGLNENEELKILFPNELKSEKNPNIFNQSWKPHVLNKFPNNSPTPNCEPPDNIWMFCFPSGIQIKKEIDSIQECFSFVMTSSVGTNFFGTCITLYEKVEKNFLEKLQGSFDIQAKKDNIEIKNNENLIDFGNQLPSHAYCPKVLCCISQHPYTYEILKWLDCMFEYHHTDINPYE